MCFWWCEKSNEHLYYYILNGWCLMMRSLWRQFGLLLILWGTNQHGGGSMTKRWVVVIEGLNHCTVDGIIANNVNGTSVGIELGSTDTSLLVLLIGWNFASLPLLDISCPWHYYLIRRVKVNFVECQKAE